MKARHLGILLLAAGAASAVSTSQAHITLEQAEAEAGSNYKAVLRVGHGCEGSATRQIVVRLPAGLRNAKPLPKPGWTLTLKFAPLVVPYTSHGKTITSELVELSWTANSAADHLQDAWYDEFTLRATLPAEPGDLVFKVRQVCVQGEMDWAEMPNAGASGASARAPAPRLRVVAPRTGSEPHPH